MNNIFKQMKTLQVSTVLATAFATAHGMDEVWSSLRFARRAMGIDATNYLDGCYFTRFHSNINCDITHSSFLDIQDMANEYLEGDR